MYYIVKKESETGKKLTEILKVGDKAFEATKDFADKYKFNKWRSAYWSAWGGISSCIDFEETPNSKIWGQGADSDEYMPKRNSNAGKAIAKEIENLPMVSWYELNMCIGFSSRTSLIGFQYGNSEYYGISVKEEWNVKVPEDCEEVTTIQFRSYFKK